MKIQFKCILFLFLILAILVSCRKNHYRVSLPKSDSGLVIERLERDLFEPDPSEIPARIPDLKKTYGGFLQFFSYVIRTGDVNDSLFAERLVSFCTDRLNNEVYMRVMEQFPDLKKVETDLDEAFRHYYYYFPDKRIPEIFTCITGFNSSIIIAGDSVLGIGLERYLGRDCEYYPQLEIYSYLAARMNSYNIVPDCMYARGVADWDFDSLSYPADNVFSRIIHEGKLKYFGKCMLPLIPDTLLFGFNPDQLKFCRNNEMQMWQYLVEHDLLFSTDQFIIRKLTGEAPFTSYFTNESPGKAALWLGFRIVESYMMRNQSVKLVDLMQNSDYQSILEGAKYNPK